MRGYRTALLFALAAVAFLAAPFISLAGNDGTFVFRTPTPLVEAVAVDFPFEFVVAGLRVAQLPAEGDGSEPLEDSASEDSVSEDSVSEDSVSEDSVSEDSASEDSLSEDSLSEDSTSAVDRLALGRNGPKEKLKLRAMIWLGAGTDGIDPATEEMAVQFGEVTLVVPAGELQQRGHSYRYRARGDGSKVKIKLREMEGGSYSLKVQLEGVDLSSIANPVLVSVAIGNDGGSAEVEAKIRTVGN